MTRTEPIPVVPVETDGGSALKKDKDTFGRKHPNFAPALVAGSYPVVLIVAILIGIFSMYYFGLFRM
jgi:hypothetical protein